MRIISDTIVLLGWGIFIVNVISIGDAIVMPMLIASVKRLTKRKKSQCHRKVLTNDKQEQYRSEKKRVNKMLQSEVALRDIPEEYKK